MLTTFARKKNHLQTVYLQMQYILVIFFRHILTPTLSPYLQTVSTFKNCGRRCSVVVFNILGSNRSKLRGIFDVMLIAVNEKTHTSTSRSRLTLFCLTVEC